MGLRLCYAVCICGLLTAVADSFGFRLVVLLSVYFFAGFGLNLTGCVWVGVNCFVACMCVSCCGFALVCFEFAVC